MSHSLAIEKSFKKQLRSHQIMLKQSELPM